MELLILFVKLLDPILAVIAIVVGLLSRRWWYVVMVLPLVPAPSEVVLAGTRLTYQFDPAIYAIAIAAAAVWAFGAFLFRKRITARSNPRNQDFPGPQPEKFSHVTAPTSELDSAWERTNGFAPLIALAFIVGIAGVIYIVTQ
jgi:hypothetical protein